MDSSVCQDTSCDVAERLYYTAKACRPIVKAGECCPSSWDCSEWERRLEKKDKCFIANAKFPMGR